MANKEELLREYERRTPDFQHLLKYMHDFLDNNELKCKHTVISRVKDFDSFYKKLIEKHYENPFSDNKDFVGIRIIYFYKDDFKCIDEYIRTHFDVIDYVDHEKENILGYPGKHFIITVNNQLEFNVVEIQVRTVLEDAWSNISHDLVYKHESEVPNIIKNELDDFIALFRISDRNFFRIKQSIIKYRYKLRGKSIIMLVDENELNYDTLLKLIKLLFKNRTFEAWEGQYSLFIKELLRVQEEKKLHLELKDIKQAVELTKKVRNFLRKNVKRTNLVVDKRGRVAAIPEVTWALMATQKFDSPYIPREWWEIINKCKSI